MAYTNSFKMDAVKYVLEHPNTTLTDCARFLGVSEDTLRKWYKTYLGFLPSKSRYAIGMAAVMSREEKEAASLSWLLKAKQDATELLQRHPNYKENIHNNTAAHKETKTAPDKDNAPDVTVPASDTEPYEENKPEEAASAPSGRGRKFLRFFNRWLQ